MQDLSRSRILAVSGLKSNREGGIVSNRILRYAREREALAAVRDQRVPAFSLSLSLRRFPGDPARRETRASREVHYRSRPTRGRNLSRSVSH